MSGRVCYLSRARGGVLVTGVRVVGRHADESWAPEPTENGSPEAVSLPSRAAAWLGVRLGQGGEDGRRLSLVCVDVDGARCAWLTAPSADPTVVSAAARQASLAGAGEGAGWTLASTGEASLQALAESAPRRRRRERPSEDATGHRLAVVTIPDVSARLFLDALDDRGVTPGAVVSLWHALASAWDPGGPSAGAPGARSDRVVADASPPTAVVLIDPEGRLVWSWSRRGELIAGGTIRVAGRAGGEGGGIRVTPDDVGRLTADWLAWSAQLGVAPARIVCLGPDAGGGAGGLSPAALGESLGRAWPGASVDLAVLDDPVGMTLRRLAELDADVGAGDPRSALVALSHRPTRAHRSVRRWSAGAIAAASAGLFAIAWRAWDAAGVIRARVADQAQTTRALIGEALPLAANSPFPMQVISDEVARLRSLRGAGKDIYPAKPILREIDAVSAALSRDAQPAVIDFQDSSAMLTVLVSDYQAGQAVLESLASIDSSSCEWKNLDTAGQGGQQGDKFRLQFVGRWRAAGEATPEGRKNP